MKCLWELNISRWTLKTRMFYSEERVRGRMLGLKWIKKESCSAQAGPETVSKRSPRPSMSNSPWQACLSLTGDTSEHHRLKFEPSKAPLPSPNRQKHKTLIFLPLLLCHNKQSVGILTKSNAD